MSKQKIQYKTRMPEELSSMKRILGEGITCDSQLVKEAAESSLEEDVEDAKLLDVTVEPDGVCFMTVLVTLHGVKQLVYIALAP